MNYAVLGLTIRFYRHAAHLTQAQLAEKADISPSYLGHLERGTRVLSVETLVKLCHALDVTANDLLPEFAGCAPSPLPASWSPKDRERLLLLLQQARALLTDMP